MGYKIENNMGERSEQEDLDFDMQIQFKSPKCGPVPDSGFHTRLYFPFEIASKFLTRLLFMIKKQPSGPCRGTNFATLEASTVRGAVCICTEIAGTASHRKLWDRLQKAIKHCDLYAEMPSFSAKPALDINPYLQWGLSNWTMLWICINRICPLFTFF